jgi:hypothetical protein
MEDFINWSDSNGFIHLPTRGTSFTWSNGRRRHHSTEKRLDRTICNQDWLNSCASTSCSTLSRSKSDHHPLLLDFQISSVRFATSFKFMQMWSHHADCKSIISRVWNSNIIGCPMYILSEKLKLLKLELKTWNKNIFGNVHDHVSLAVKKLDSIQEEINVRGCLDELFDQEKQANIDLENALNMEELYWRDKARTKWHCDGDRNTAYFHRIAKIKQTTKKISSLRINDNIVTDPSLIASHVVNHFTALFSTNNHVQDNSSSKTQFLTW